jgi:hypothetical protein
VAQVVVEVRHGVGYCHHDPVVIELLVVICDEGGVLLCILNLHYGDMVLQRMLKAFVC